MRDFHRVCLGLVIVVAALNGCKKDPAASLFDPNYTSGQQPTISAVTPQDSAIAALGVVTLTGTSFSTVKENNFVYFNRDPAVVIQASATQLAVQAPNVPSENVMVKVGVLGAELFSEPVHYKLYPPVVIVGELPNVTEDPFGIACDNAGNAYVSILYNGVGIGVKKLTPTVVRDTLTRSDYSPPFSTAINRWTAMKVGPGGYIYCAANRNAVWRIPPGGGASALWKNTASVGVSLVYDIDFDQAGNVWGAGANAALVRIKPDLSAAAFPFAGDVRSVRVYDNHLYLATKRDSLWAIWRCRIYSSDSLGAPENYFDWSGRYGANGPGAYAITFTTTGEMLVGTDTSAGTIAIVHPDRTAERFYPGNFRGSVVSFAYGRADELFVTRTGNANADKKIFRVWTQMQGAPYYGRQ
jgi:hypothetical protein